MDCAQVNESDCLMEIVMNSLIKKEPDTVWCQALFLRVKVM